MSTVDFDDGSPAGRTQTNGLGIAGFVVSLVGLVATCGLLCPLGVLFSLIALLRPPRGFAFAGLMVGLVGTTFLALIGFGFVMSLLGVQAAGKEAVLRMQEVQTREMFTRGERIIELHRSEAGELPDGIEGNKLVIELKDAWQNSIRYDRENGDYLLRSAGPDGQFDTADDLTSDDLTSQPGVSSHADE